MSFSLLSFIAFAFVSLIDSASAAGCSASNESTNIFIDIHPRVVDGTTDFFQYGLFIGGGTPSQNQSLWLSLSHNVTSFASHEFCQLDSSVNCVNYTHGTFGKDDSQSWIDVEEATFVDTSSTFSSSNVSFGQDTLNLFTHYIDPSPPSVHYVANHPIALLSDYNSSVNPFFSAGSLGLGSSSYLLSSLVESDVIASNSFGFYLGTNYDRAGGSVNGSLVLGGYDSARIGGQVYQYAQTPTFAAGASPFQVQINDIILTTSDGITHHLLSTDYPNGIDASISIDQYPIQFPSDITSQLGQLLGATNTLSPDGTLVLSNAFTGNFTISLAGGYNITYDSQWISNTSNITPFASTTSQQQQVSTVNNITQASIGNGPIVLGAAFLHHIYMAVSYDSQPATFFLADVAANSYVQTATLCADSQPVAATRPKISSFAQNGMVGVVLGASIGGSAVIAVLFYLVRRRLMRRASEKRWNAATRPADDGPKSIMKQTKSTTTKRVSVYPVAKRISFTESDSSESDEDEVRPPLQPEQQQQPQSPPPPTPVKKDHVVTVKDYNPNRDIEMGELPPTTTNKQDVKRNFSTKFTRIAARLSNHGPISPLPLTTGGAVTTRNDSPVSPLNFQLTHGNINNNNIDKSNNNHAHGIIRTTTFNIPASQESQQISHSFDTRTPNSSKPLLVSRSSTAPLPSLTIQTTDLRNPTLKTRTVAQQRRSNKPSSPPSATSRSKSMFKRLSSTSTSEREASTTTTTTTTTDDYLRLRDQLSPSTGVQMPIGAGFKETAYRKMFPAPT